MVSQTGVERAVTEAKVVDARRQVVGDEQFATGHEAERIVGIVIQSKRPAFQEETAGPIVKRTL